MKEIYKFLILFFCGASFFSVDGQDVEIRKFNSFQVQENKDSVLLFEYEVKADSLFSLEKYEQAIAIFNLALSIDEENSYSYYIRGLSKLRIGERIEAIKDFTKSIKYSNQVDESLLWDLSGRGSRFLVGSATSFSIEHQYHHVYFFRGLAKYELDDFYGAISDFEITVSMNSDFEVANFVMGLCYYYLGKFNQAEKHFSLELFLNEDHMKAYFYRGLSRINIKKTKEGCLDLSRAGELGIEEAYDSIRLYCQ